MSNELIRKELVLPSGINAPVIMDSTGKCWVIKGLRDNVDNITNIPDGVKIIKSEECCESCITGDTIDDLLIDDTVVFPSASSETI